MAPRPMASLGMEWAITTTKSRRLSEFRVFGSAGMERDKNPQGYWWIMPGFIFKQSVILTLSSIRIYEGKIRKIAN